MFLEILSPEKSIFSGEIFSVKVPGEFGEFEILKNHAPIISSLKAGFVFITNIDMNKQKQEIRGGIIEAISNKIIILVS